jgi:DNA-binding beta-propeller fold protein YncE
VTFSGGLAHVATVAGKLNMPGLVNATGTQAQFGHLSALAFDGAHTLYITDGDYNVVRAFDTNSSAVTTFAGTSKFGDDNGTLTTATFRYPRGLAYDRAAKLLYVAEQYGSCIRVIDVGAANVTTLVGSCGTSGSDDGGFGNAKFNQPQQLTLDPTGKVLYVADNQNQTVRTVDLVGQKVKTLVGVVGKPLTKPGPYPAHVHNPVGLAVTPPGLIISSPDENTLLLAN